VESGSTARQTVDGTQVVLLPVDAPQEATKVFCVVLQSTEETAAERVRDLESRLAAARQYLVTVLDDYGCSTEELRSAYEELRTANEELHRVNEELVVANRDLGNLNALLDGRSRELQRVNAELSNVLSSVGIPVLMLDMDLRLRRFTPHAGRFFQLRAGDVGKAFTELNLDAALPDLLAVCREVVTTFTPVLRQVETPNRRQFSLLVRPYRTEENRIEGVIVALLEEALPASRRIVLHEPAR
jgi:two-component system CheB/CheR fusion protein